MSDFENDKFEKIDSENNRQNFDDEYESINEEEAANKRKRTIIRIIIITAVIIVLLLLLRNCNGCTDPNSFKTDLSSVAVVENINVLNANGDIESTDEDMLKDLQDVMTDSNVPMVVNAVPYAARQGDPINWFIENPTGSNKNLYIEVFTLNDDGSLGEKIYETKGLLPPSSHVSCIDKNTGEELHGYDYLDKELPPGSYKAGVFFHAYTMDGHPVYIGTAEALVDVKINNI